MTSIGTESKFAYQQQEQLLDYQKYTNYVDPSIMTIQHYRKKYIFQGSTKYIIKIEQWLSESKQGEENKPLIFQSQPGIGKKAMLVEWLQHHKNLRGSKRQKNLVLLHFASIGGNNTNYFYGIYRLLIRLREALKIKQKVELLQQKIRKYFAYWLDVCSSELQKQLILNQTTEIYDKIIIVIQGIENFIDPETGKQSNIAFWLPKYFPKNIKVIITADQSSEAIKYFHKIGCQIVIIQPSPQIQDYILLKAKKMGSILDKKLEETLFMILEELIKTEKCRKNIYLFIEAFVSGFIIPADKLERDVTKFLKNVIQKKLMVDHLKNLVNLEELFDFLLTFWNQHIELKGKLKELLIVLLINQKGLTLKQITELCKINEKQWAFFHAIFRVILIQYQGFWMIHEATFKNVVFRKFHIKDEIIRQFHQKISDVLDQTPNSIRKLEEQTYHLYVSKSYFKLKENISNIENFLLLFNPNNKYDLSRYWQKLEEKGFDPVIQYNKAIQGFSMHYHPTQENIFRIIVQISRFLKQFCDFQTYYTPNFRHPPIQGNMIEMDKIGLLRQLQKLNIYVDNSCTANQQKLINHPSLSEQIKELKQKYFQNNQNKQQTIPQQNARKPNNVTVSNLTKNFDPQKKQISNNILNEIEQLNVDVPKNRQKFRTYYINLLKDYIQKKQIANNDQSQNSNYLQNQQNEEQKIDYQKMIKKQKQVQLKLCKIKDTFNTSDIEPTLYYYKRWIWIQFPWACISLHNDYSKTPELCLTSATEYMSVETQAEFTRQALKIAIEAKQKKKMMFTKKSDLSNTVCGWSKKSMSKNTMNQNFQIRQINSNNLRKNSSTNNLPLSQSGSRNKMILGNITLNLSTLTKQLESKKNNRKIPVNEGVVFETTESEQTSKDMDFIDRRKNYNTVFLLNSMSKNEILPKLKNEINSHTQYQLNYIKSHIEQKKKIINQITYQNSKLANLYQQLKIKEYQTGGEESNNKASKRMKTFEDLDRKKQHTITEFCKSLLQKERLKIILKLCSENKTKNQQYLSSLNYLLLNLKKMIKWERADMKTLEQELIEIQQLNEKTNQAQKEKQQNQQLLNKQIKQSMKQKNDLQKQISNMSAIISKEVNSQKNKLENNISGDRLKNQQKNKQLQLQKNTKMIEDQLQQMQNCFQKLAKILNINDFDYRSSKRFQKLMEEKERNKQLRIILFERKNKLELLQSIIQSKKEDISIKFQETKPEINKTNENLGNPENLEQIQNFNKILSEKSKTLKTITDNNLKMKIGLQNIALRLKLKEVNKNEAIILSINQKLDKLKSMSEEKYNDFMENRLDLGQLYFKHEQRTNKVFEEQIINN